MLVVDDQGLFADARTAMSGLDDLGPVDFVDALYGLVTARNFATALTKLDKLNALAITVPEVTVEVIEQALTRSDVTYGELTPIIDPNEPERGRRTRILKQRGYRGPRPSADQTRRLLEFRDLLANGPERNYRIRLIRAECHVGLARANTAAAGLTPAEHFAAALTQYQRLLPPGSRPLSPRQVFVSTRVGHAQAARGDALFRRAFRFTVEERQEIVGAYCAAVGAVDREGVTGPAADQVRAYANHQLTKVMTGQNFLGYHDTDVPDLSPAVLAGLADARIQAADNASRQFQSFKTRADELIDQLATLSQGRRAEEVGLRIADLTIEKADERVSDANDAIERIKSRSDDLLASLGAGIAQSVFATVTLAATGGAGGAGGGSTFGGQVSGPGLISSFVQYRSAKEELDNQLQAARSALRIAERDQQIARLEKQIAQSRLTFINAAITAKQTGDFNADRFYAVANAYEDMTRRHLDRACELLYLYERAVAFRRLKSLRIVEAAAARGDVLLAPAQLRAAFLDITEEARSNGRGQNAFSLPPLSLRSRHPVEFARFLQTGSMDFAISVYDVERLLHGSYNVRIERVGVRMLGLVAPDGFVGSLIHRGVTLVRDRDATLNPPTARLTPTDAQLAAALTQLEEGKADRLVVEGIVPLSLGEGRLAISSEPETPDQGDEFDLLPIENYGLTGAWQLNLPDTDLRGVFDVQVTFVVSLPESDSALDRHVRNLIRSYETELADNQALDGVLGIAVRRRFPDTFDALRTGTATLDLRDVDFPADAAQPRVKAVLAQALDAEGTGLAGIRLEIAHTAALTLNRTTGPDGFTEDLTTGPPDLPEPQRVPPAGTWQLRLPDPAQFPQLDELMLFVVYTFRRSES